jgi:hypothetical protein
MGRRGARTDLPVPTCFRTHGGVAALNCRWEITVLLVGLAQKLQMSTGQVSYHTNSSGSHLQLSGDSEFLEEHYSLITEGPLGRDRSRFRSLLLFRPNPAALIVCSRLLQCTALLSACSHLSDGNLPSEAKGAATLVDWEVAPSRVEACPSVVASTGEVVDGKVLPAAACWRIKLARSVVVCEAHKSSLDLWDPLRVSSASRNE